MSFMGNYEYVPQEDAPIGYEDDAWYRGASTATGAGVGAGLGALGYLIPGVGAFAGPALMSLGGAAGGFLGGLFEPDAPDVKYAAQPDAPVLRESAANPMAELPGSALLEQLAAEEDPAMGQYQTLSQEYGVDDLYGFNQQKSYPYQGRRFS
jgi:hypothetical protein